MVFSWLLTPHQRLYIDEGVAPHTTAPGIPEIAEHGHIRDTPRSAVAKPTPITPGIGTRPQPSQYRLLPGESLRSLEYAD